MTIRTITFTISFLIISPFFCLGQTVDKPYALVSNIAIGDSLKWDYLVIDSVNNHLFVSHQTKVLVIDLLNEKVVAEISQTPGVH
jgi:hypothetical protein